MSLESNIRALALCRVPDYARHLMPAVQAARESEHVDELSSRPGAQARTGSFTLNR